MKYIRILFVSLFFVPFVARAAQNDFMVAAQLLAAARNADIQQVQVLVNNGANINYVDATGLSLVCTALMNNDTRAAQILQMYGADASQCDRQIKKYKNRTVPERSGGLFSGLSSAQSMTLTAAGAAVVIGGLLLLTDVFDPGNDNDNYGPSTGNRPGGNNGDSGEEGSNVLVQLPYGPACSSDGTCPTDLTYWGPDSSDPQKAADFAAMAGMNPLLMTYAYNAFARGYLGQSIIRLSKTNTPFDLNSLPYPTGTTPGGGKPINVATITTNGVNSTGSLGDGYISWVDAGQVINAQNQCSKYGEDSTQCNAALAAMTKRARKFYNRTNMTDLDDLTELDGFDLSGFGTVFGDAINSENLAVKVVGGWESPSRATGDYYGFIPNGQLTIYRTGGGMAFDETVGAVTNAVDATTWSNNDTFTIDGATYTISINTNANTFTATDGGANTVSGAVNESTLNFAIGGTNYIAQFGGDVSSLKVADVKNFEAMYNAANLSVSGTPWVNVIANIAQNPGATNSGYLKFGDFHALAAGLTTDASKLTAFQGYIDQYYNLDTSNDASVNKPSWFANSLYNVVGNQQNQIIVNSAGAYEYGVGDGKSIEALGATFENYAPVLYPNLEHLFVTVVAVENTKGTNVTDINGYPISGGKIRLADWYSGFDVSDGTYENHFASRKCGMSISGGLDPWCFAAPGLNSEMAVASMAGAIGMVQGAFNGMTLPSNEKNINKMMFKLLALTADGPYLGTKPGTTSGWTDQADLISYLQSMYELPGEYAGISDDEYLDVFKDVFGYGMINVERATRPGTKIYYYNGTDIVSADGDKLNAYWRAATNTMFRASGALNLSGTRIGAAVFDLLESADGSMRMPRVWESEFAMGNTSKRGLYMGDVLGDFKVRGDGPTVMKIGNVSLGMAVSERAYVDNMGGLDNLALNYENDNWGLAASYQRHFTDGQSRFSGMANPILNLASNVVATGAEYKVGDWAFGGRGFSGIVTDEGLLENDPTISAQFVPGTLGYINGAESHASYAGDKFGFTTSFGVARESDTLLGAESHGLLNMGAGNTTYVDVVSRYDMSDDFGVMARATFARTTSDAMGPFVMGLSSIESNAFAFGANIGNLEFSIAQPLAITDGALKYAHAKYDVVESDDGNYDLVVRDAHVANLSMRPDVRETRLMGTYRHRFGEFTDGAFGFIYRINPNHTDEFGNESIFMMKLSHRLGI